LHNYVLEYAYMSFGQILDLAAFLLKPKLTN
jgi:hypothetical protein